MSEYNVFRYTVRAQKTFPSLSRRDYQCPQCRSYVKCAIFPSKNEQVRFFLKCDQEFYSTEETQTLFQDAAVDVFCLGRYRSKQKCVFIHTWKKIIKTVMNVFYAIRAAII